MIRYSTKALLIALLFSGCGSYRYYHPTPNSALFKGKGEVHISGDVGSSGFSAKGAVSVSDNLGIIGMYNASPFEYRVREGEVGIGYYKLLNPISLFIVGGIGFGSNFEYTDSTYTTKRYEGDFFRPFIQLNSGITGGNLFWGIKGDVIGTLKVGYFNYKGRHLDATLDPINSGYVYLQPGALWAIGGKRFKMDLSVGFPFRPSLDPLPGRSNARIVPGSVGIGFRYIFGRNK